MRYAVLLYQDEAFAKAASDRGYALDGDALSSASDATTVRRSGSEVTITDGPFAETAEQFGGFYVLDAPDLDEVLELVRLLPEYTIEIRRIVDLD